jgi:hypothetical protein
MNELKVPSERLPQSGSARAAADRAALAALLEPLDAGLGEAGPAICSQFGVTSVRCVHGSPPPVAPVIAPSYCAAAPFILALHFAAGNTQPVRQ